MILGLDISLTNTGFCLLDKGRVYKMGLVKSKPNIDRFERFNTILGNLAPFIEKASFVVIEGYSFASVGKVFDIAELSGIIKAYIWSLQKPFIEVPPNTLKKFVTGNGNADKNIMMTKAFKTYGIEFDDDNICDAFCLAKYGEEYKRESHA